MCLFCAGIVDSGSNADSNNSDVVFFSSNTVKTFVRIMVFLKVSELGMIQIRVGSTLTKFRIIQITDLFPDLMSDIRNG